MSFEYIYVFADVMKILLMIASIIALFHAVGLGKRYLELKQTTFKQQMDHEIEIESIRFNQISYSENILNIIKKVVGEVLVLKFRTFRDTHDMLKVTRANLMTLAEEIAMDVKESLDIDLGDTIFRETFVDQYIVDTSFAMTKQLFEDNIGEIID